MHIAFRIPISEYESFDRLIDFISNECKKRKLFFEDSKMICPCLISSMKWKFGYVFLKVKQKMENNALERMCNKIVDVIYKTFTREYYFVKIFLSKK